jgi:8-oxo-dGTP pyrophosphatase MutT (NUDIX family)
MRRTGHGVIGLIRSLFFRPPILQVAALCTQGGQVLLIRSLNSNRWILPKGWPMRGCTLAEAATQEAWEEAGVRGTACPHAIGHYRSRKRGVGGLWQASDVHVFAIAVESVATVFPESGLRQVAWFAPQDAAEKLREPGLRALLLRHLGIAC